MTRGSDDAGEEVGGAVRRIRHLPRVIVFVVVAAVLVAGAFVAGRFVQSPDADALARANTTVPVFAAVQERIVDDGFSIVGQVQKPASTAIIVTEASSQASATVPRADAAAGVPSSAAAGAGDAQPAVPEAGPSADRIVVSAQQVKPGTVLSPGVLIAEVSGRPLFAWPDGTPLYRDLAVGDSGSDVRGLQKALSDAGFYHGPADGRFGAGTFSALRDMYDAVGYRAPYVRDGVQGFAWLEVAPLPRVPARVLRVAGIGTVLDADHPLAEVETSPAVITGVATVQDAENLKPGTAVRVSVRSSPPMESTVIAIGEFTTDDKTGVSGHPISVALPEGLKAAAGDSVVIRPDAAPEPRLAMPAAAIRQDAQGAYVLRLPEAADKASTSSTTPYTKIRVTARIQADGWVAINDTPELSTGQKVLVTGG